MAGQVEEQKILDIPPLDLKDPDKIADAFLLSEQKYVDRALRVAEEVFLTPLRQMNKLDINPLLSDEEIDAIFLTLASIHRSHRLLEEELMSLRMKGTLVDNIGAIMMRQIPYFKTYSDYIHGFRDSQVKVSELKASKPEFQKWLALYESCTKITLTELIDMPVARLPQYAIYMDALLLASDPDNPPPKVREATAEIEKVLNSISVAVKERGARALVLKAQQEWFSGSCNLLEPTRVHIKNGELTVVNEKGGFFTTKFKTHLFVLFNDCLVYGNKAGRFASGKLLGVYHIETLIVQDLGPENPAFKICTGEPITCQAATIEEKNKWIKAIKKEVKRSNEQKKQRKQEGVVAEEVDPTEFARWILQQESVPSRRTSVVASRQRGASKMVSPIITSSSSSSQPSSAGPYSGSAGMSAHSPPDAGALVIKPAQPPRPSGPRPGSGPRPSLSPTPSSPVSPGASPTPGSSSSGAAAAASGASVPVAPSLGSPEAAPEAPKAPAIPPRKRPSINMGGRKPPLPALPPAAAAAVASAGVASGASGASAGPSPGKGVVPQAPSLDASPPEAPSLDPADLPPEAPALDFDAASAEPEPEVKVVLKKTPEAGGPKPAPAAAAAGGDVGDLLAQIRGGAKLKKVEPRSGPAPAAADSDPLRAALKASLGKYRKFVQNEEQSSEEDNDQWD